MNTTNSNQPGSSRALVLGGGGATGNAWLIGIIAGLHEAGAGPLEADLIIGTSAGSTAAAQLTSASPGALLTAVLATPSPQRVPAGRGSTGAAATHLERTNAIIAAATDAADMRRRIGAAALATDAASDGTARRWRDTVAARLPSQQWPEQRLLITAVDARSGEPAVFDRDSGVDLADAVAASCAGGGFAYPIGDSRYIDGGYRRNENADLAAGYDRVLVLSPFGGRTRHPAAWGMQLQAQVAELRAGGSTVETIFPDADFDQLFGANAVNPSLRPDAARAGYRQGRAAAGQINQFWC